MKKLLIITNLFTLSILGGILFKKYSYKFRVNSEQKVTQKYPAPCEYQLKYFDFHFKAETPNPKIIMLGNSLIRRGNWDSLLQRTDVINRGISGDKLRCICERLFYLKNATAKICFIEGGINDLPGENVDSLFKYYREISEESTLKPVCYMYHRKPNSFYIKSWILKVPGVMVLLKKLK